MTFGLLFPTASAARAVRLLALTTALQNLVNTTIPRIQNARPRFEIKTSSPLLSFAVSNKRDDFNRNTEVNDEREERIRQRKSDGDSDYDTRPQRIQVIPAIDVLSLNPGLIQQQPQSPPTTIFHHHPQTTNGQPNTLVIRILDTPSVSSPANSGNIVTPTLNIQHNNPSNQPTSAGLLVVQRNGGVIHATSTGSVTPFPSTSSPLNPHVVNNSNINVQESLLQQLVLEALKDNIRRKVLDDEYEKSRITRFDSQGEGNPPLTDTPVSTSSSIFLKC